MLIKPKNYDEVVVGESNYSPIELGGHKGVIMNAEEYTGQSGNVSLKVYVDTDKTDSQPEYFSTQFKNDTRPDKKWSNSAIKYVSLKEDESCIRMLKAFITSVENSNEGFKFDWNKEVTQLKGKKIGLVYGLEEFKIDDEIKTTRKINRFGTYNKIEGVSIPNVRLLNGSYMDYDDYEETHNNNDTKIADELEKAYGGIEITVDDLPF